ncbi:ferredoxin reductase, partial [Acinetobacter baumannii]|nr:ferredoxin reductase [Acinetobacter baumannii]
QALKQQLEQIHVIYFNRAEIFHTELKALAEQYPQLQYHFFNTTEQKQHLTESLLQKLVPDFEQTATYVCGHHGMMQQANEIYTQKGAQSQL